MVGGFVADEIAPHAAELDREGVRLEDGEAVFPPRLRGHLRADQASSGCTACACRASSAA